MDMDKVSTPPTRDPKADKAMETIRRWSHYLDKAFRIPGTRMRFGWDPILGLIPGFGDIAAGLFSVFILIQSFRVKIPGIIRARMVLNALIDAVSGAFPLIGDIFDFVWKSNSLNLALLEKHAGAGIEPETSDWIFVLGILAASVAIVILPILIVIVVFRRLQALFPGKPLWEFL